MPTNSTPIPAIRFEGIGKRFPGVQALTDVTLDIQAGTCHALMGENGAGKSTLGKILAGLQCPDQGRLLINGLPVRFRNPRDARLAGIGIVHQELAFCENLSVAENLGLSQLPARAGWLDRQRLRMQAQDALSILESDIDVDQPVGQLSVGRQQLVQIAGAVAGGARIIVFDEPTSSLSHGETQRLFTLIRRLKSISVTSIYVSHRLEEIFELCDPVTVLRDGRVIDTMPINRLTQDRLIEMMIGKPFQAHRPNPAKAQDAMPERLRVEHLSHPGIFEDISFAVRAGEIVGLAGLVGAGRSEVAAAIFGLDPVARGNLFVEGQPVTMATPRDAMRHGIGLAPEDRKKQGLVLGMSARENISMAVLDRLAFHGWVNRQRENSLAMDYFAKLRVRAPHLDTPALALSGGNQQKLVLAKWLAADSRILIVDEPTRGVDVGAKSEIHALLNQVAHGGGAVLVISSELPEVLSLADRILVMREGRLVGDVPKAEATQASILRLITGC